MVRGVLEVALRNALHKQLTNAFSSPWYDDAKFLAIDAHFPDQIQKAKSDISKWGKAVTPPRVVAELSFGFWVNLLRPGTNSSYVYNLWGPAFSNAFPNGTKRGKISGILDPLLKFETESRTMNQSSKKTLRFDTAHAGNGTSLVLRIGAVDRTPFSRPRYHCSRSLPPSLAFLAPS